MSRWTRDPMCAAGRTILARSCDVCGHFKEREKFGRTLGWKCDPCRARIRKAQMATKDRRARERREYARWFKPANLSDGRRHGFHWTGPELETIARADLTARQAAVMLGRSVAAVKRQRHLLVRDPRKVNAAGPSRRTA